MKKKIRVRAITLTLGGLGVRVRGRVRGRVRVSSEVFSRALKF